MIIKKRVREKVTGKISVTFSSNKEGFKVIFDEKGIPKEVKMSTKERKNRAYGYSTDGEGAVGSQKKQTGISKINMKSAKYYKEKINNMLESSDREIELLNKKIEKLQIQLRQNKVAKKEIELNRLQQELQKKELMYRTAEQFISKDKQNLRDKNLFYVKDEPNEKVLSKISDIVSDNAEKTLSESNTDVLYKLDRFIAISEKKIIKEADEEEDEDPELDPTDETSEDTPPEDEEDTTDETGEEEDLNTEEDLYVQPNEIENLVTINNYDIDANNIYDFYDAIFPKLIDPTSKKALNAEYSTIPENKLNVTPATDFYKRVTNRLTILNKAEDENINGLASGTDNSSDGGADDTEDSGLGDLNI